MDLVEEENRATLVGAESLASRGQDGPNVFHARAGRRQGLEGGIHMVSDESGQRRLPVPGGPHSNIDMGRPDDTIRRNAAPGPRSAG